MEWILILVAVFAVAGVVLTIRERRTGRGGLVDERPHDAAQTEADREAIRAQDAAHHHASGWHHH